MDAAIQTPDASLQDLGAEIARDLLAGKFADVVERMSPELAAVLPASKLASLWASMLRDMGPCTIAGEIVVETQVGFTVVSVPLKFGARTLDLNLAVAAGRLIGIHLVPHQDRAPPWRSPDYADPATFHEADVRFGPEPQALPGTLTLPNAPGPAPAVILVHGSGPQDRDESLGPNRPFRDLATGLATRGIAVLRYDKRTKVYPQSFVALKHPTVDDETIDDVLRAVEFLKTRPEIDPNRIAIVGHSLGATLAPRIAARSPSIASIVLLAAASRPLPEIVVAQAEYLAGLNGPVSAADADGIARLKVEAARVLAARPGDEGPAFLGVPLSYWIDLDAYDPAEAAAHLSIPMLILQGDRDYQVTTEDFDRFRDKLAGHANASLHVLSRLNHEFMQGTAKGGPADYDIPGHVSADVVRMTADFVLAK